MKRHLQNLHKLLQTVCTNKEDLQHKHDMRPKGRNNMDASDAHKREDSGEFSLEAPGKHGHYSNYCYSLVIRELRGFPISTETCFLKSCDQIMWFFVTAVIWSK